MTDPKCSDDVYHFDSADHKARLRGLRDKFEAQNKGTLSFCSSEKSEYFSIRSSDSNPTEPGVSEESNAGTSTPKSQTNTASKQDAPPLRTFWETASLGRKSGATLLKKSGSESEALCNGRKRQRGPWAVHNRNPRIQMDRITRMRADSRDSSGSVASGSYLKEPKPPARKPSLPPQPPAPLKSYRNPKQLVVGTSIDATDKVIIAVSNRPAVTTPVFINTPQTDFTRPGSLLTAAKQPIKSNDEPLRSPQTLEVITTASPINRDAQHNRPEDYPLYTEVLPAQPRAPLVIRSVSENPRSLREATKSAARNVRSLLVGAEEDEEDCRMMRSRSNTGSSVKSSKLQECIPKIEPFPLPKEEDVLKAKKPAVVARSTKVQVTDDAHSPAAHKFPSPPILPQTPSTCPYCACLESDIGGEGNNKRSSKMCMFHSHLVIDHNEQYSGNDWFLVHVYLPGGYTASRLPAKPSGDTPVDDDEKKRRNVFVNHINITLNSGEEPKCEAFEQKIVLEEKSAAAVKSVVRSKSDSRHSIGSTGSSRKSVTFDDKDLSPQPSLDEILLRRHSAISRQTSSTDNTHHPTISVPIHRRMSTAGAGNKLQFSVCLPEKLEVEMGKSILFSVNTQCPKHRVIWLKDDKPILSESGRYQVIQFGDNHILTLDSCKTSDAGVYSAVLSTSENFAADDTRTTCVVKVLPSTPDQDQTLNQRMLSKTEAIHYPYHSSPMFIRELPDVVFIQPSDTLRVDTRLWSLPQRHLVWASPDDEIHVTACLKEAQRAAALGQERDRSAFETSASGDVGIHTAAVKTGPGLVVNA